MQVQYRHVLARGTHGNQHKGQDAFPDTGVASADFKTQRNSSSPSKRRCPQSGPLPPLTKSIIRFTWGNEKGLKAKGGGGTLRLATISSRHKLRTPNHSFLVRGVQTVGRGLFTDESASTLGNEGTLIHKRVPSCITCINYGNSSLIITYR
jgi:hypothetical protein